MKKYPVSSRVNSPENEEVACEQQFSSPNTEQLLF
jgi:hypothetical protein